MSTIQIILLITQVLVVIFWGLMYYAIRKEKKKAVNYLEECKGLLDEAIKREERIEKVKKETGELLQKIVSLRNGN